MKRSQFFIGFFVLPALLSVAAWSQAVVDAAGPGSRFVGKLDAELGPDMVHIYQRVFERPAGKVNFIPALNKGAVISAGEIIDPRSASGTSVMWLVETAGNVFAAADVDGNGSIEEGERFPLSESRADATDLETVVRLPITNVLFKTFPIFIQYKRGFKHPKLKSSDRFVLQTAMALAYGTVVIVGQDVRFQYPFDPGSPTISTTEGLFGVDVDGDGRIRDEQFSPESSYATNSEIVFKFGDTYLSTEKIDLAKNQITVRGRAKEEYQRLDLAVGKIMRDFSFVDFDGKARSLYDFKGKYVLIDFWGVWCADCRVETPFHVEAMKRFRGRGLDILSLNTDEKIEIAKVYMQKNGMTWTQARNDSIRHLVEVSYRIQEYPSTILIGPDGKVLVLDQRQLRGEELLKILDRKLPK